MSLLYHRYTTGPGCHGDARLLPKDIFTFRVKVFFGSPIVKKKRLRCEKSVLPDRVGMTRVELVWSNKLVLCCLTQLPAGRHTTQRLRWSGGVCCGQKLDGVLPHPSETRQCHPQLSQEFPSKTWSTKKRTFMKRWIKNAPHYEVWTMRTSDEECRSKASLINSARPDNHTYHFLLD